MNRQMNDNEAHIPSGGQNTQVYSLLLQTCSITEAEVQLVNHGTDVLNYEDIGMFYRTQELGFS
jgi:hypothetical protein